MEQAALSAPWGISSLYCSTKILSTIKLGIHSEAAWSWLKYGWTSIVGCCPQYGHIFFPLSDHGLVLYMGFIFICACSC